MIRLVALLAWYNEQADWLRDTVMSLPLAGVDHLVAVDGAYALFPNGKAQSHHEQHESIADAAEEAGIDCTICLPQVVWESNELEKRTYMFREGERYEPDWYLVIDADERILKAPSDLKERLSSTPKDYADVLSLENQSKAWGAEVEGSVVPSVVAGRYVKPRRCLIRAVPGIVCSVAHYHYIAPDGRNLWGDEMGDPLRIRDFIIDHRCHERDTERRQAALDYYDVRDATGAEKHRKVKAA